MIWSLNIPQHTDLTSNIWQSSLTSISTRLSSFYLNQNKVILSQITVESLWTHLWFISNIIDAASIGIAYNLFNPIDNTINRRMRYLQNYNVRGFFFYKNAIYYIFPMIPNPIRFREATVEFIYSNWDYPMPI